MFYARLADIRMTLSPSIDTGFTLSQCLPSETSNTRPRTIMYRRMRVLDQENWTVGVTRDARVSLVNAQLACRVWSHRWRIRKI
jgi:hypothetical protein